MKYILLFELKAPSNMTNISSAAILRTNCREIYWMRQGIEL